MELKLTGVVINRSKNHTGETIACRTGAIFCVFQASEGKREASAKCDGTRLEKQQQTREFSRNFFIENSLAFIN